MADILIDFYDVRYVIRPVIRPRREALTQISQFVT